MSNLAQAYRERGIPACSIKIGTKLKVMSRAENFGSPIDIGSIGTVTDSCICDGSVEGRCEEHEKQLCHGYILSVKIDGSNTAHSCYFRFCTLEGIPILF